MIRRTLVPLQLTPVKPGLPGENGHRRTSALDVRTVVPPEISSAPFDAKTAIPAHLPLDVLSARMLIPRDMPVKQMETTTAIPSHVPLAVLGTRVVVPQEAKFDRNAPIAPAAPLPAILFEDIIEPDLFTTGQVNLLASPDKANARAKDWQWLSRSFSLIVHVGVILFVLLVPKMFPNTSAADQEVNLARQQLSSVFLPPSVKEVPKARPKVEPQSPRIRLDPRVLEKLAQTPPAPEPLAGPKNTAPPQPEAPQPTQASPPPAFQSLSQIINPPKPDHPLNLQLPRLSPEQALQQSAQNALRNGAGSSNSAAFSEPMPRQRGGLPSSGAGGQGLLGAGVQILTPTEGVDFSNYITRLLARVKQNWEAVMPVSAQMGEKGVVMLQFHIMRNGDLPSAEPFLVRTSGEGSLDGAARSAITASNPFEALPPAFSGPYIELRIIFLYNLPLDYNYQ